MDTKVLIVEDESLIALDLKQKLEQQFGYTVPAIVDNAAEALQSVETLHPSLVLMDIRLRGPKDGIHAAHRIRRQFDVPIIFLTAYADPDTLRRARACEPFGYIVKPFHSHDFRAQIEMALVKHRSEKKLRASVAWFSAMARNVADALIATDSAGNVAFINSAAARLTGWNRRAAIGKPLLGVLQVFETEADHPVMDLMAALNHGLKLRGEPRTLQLRQRGSQDLLSVEARFSANLGPDGLPSVVVSLRDIARRQRSRKRNRQQDYRRDLGLLTGSPDLARPPNPARPLDLNDFVSSLEARLTIALGDGRTLRLGLQPGIPLVRADRDGLRDCFLRLILDARLTTNPAEGEVEISTAPVRRDNELCAQIAFRDNRMAHRVPERGFDPHSHAGAVNRNDGISLGRVFQFMAESGGAIKIETTPAGGLTYLLLFPPAGEIG